MIQYKSEVLRGDLIIKKRENFVILLDLRDKGQGVRVRGQGSRDYGIKGLELRLQG